MDFSVQGQRPYRLAHPEHIETPRLVVFEDRVQSNIRRMGELLDRAAPGTGFDLLAAHVKTHKSSAILRCLMDAGVRSFKASFNEVDLCLEAGVPELFVAYPLLEDRARGLDRLISTHPETQVTVQFGTLDQAEILRRVARETGRVWRAFLDVDVGMHRTGARPDEASTLYRTVADWPEIDLVGLHGYDGHIHHADEAERRAASQAAMAGLVALFEELTGQGYAVPRVMVAGSPSLPTDLDILVPRLAGRTRLQFSPGTWIYWDSGYDALMPGAFEMAALILARVLERHGDRLTLNLGHKRWAADQGAVNRFSIDGAQVASFNEEHTVLAVPGSCPLTTGDYVLIAPRHVCSTVNLWEHFVLVGVDGEIFDAASPVDGRNR